MAKIKVKVSECMQHNEILHCFTLDCIQHIFKILKDTTFHFPNVLVPNFHIHLLPTRR